MELDGKAEEHISKLNNKDVKRKQQRYEDIWAGNKIKNLTRKGKYTSKFKGKTDSCKLNENSKRL